MLRLTLAQMRRSIGRLTAAGVAIMIGTAFVATTLLAGNVMTRSTYDAVTATFADADLVVLVGLDDAQLAAVRATPGVEAADRLAVGGTELRAGGERLWQNLIATPSDPRLSSVELTEGSAPQRPGQVALPADSLERLEVGLGDTLQTTRVEWVDAAGDVVDPAQAGAADVTYQEVVEDVTVVGVVDDPNGAWSQLGGTGVATLQDLLAWSGTSDPASLTRAVTIATSGDVAAVRADLTTALDGTEVLTKDEAAALGVESIAGDSNPLVMVVLGFAAVALLVAALVIANTFQVLVAQRTRTLALLRCVGARSSQLRASVLTEAAVLGVVASTAGLLVGTGLAQLALTVAGGADLGMPLPSTVAVTGTVVLAPLLVGTLVTVLASLVPAREATRVAPIAALRPADAPVVSARSGRVRLVLALLLGIGGLAGLLLAVAISVTPAGPMLALGIGILAGAASFVGVLLGAVFWMPRVVALAGRLLASTGPSARLAAANSLRNPRRTAATSTALLIGVTLVAMMSTGAASARTSLLSELDQRYAVDVAITAEADGVTPPALPDGLATRVAQVDGVQDVLAVPTTPVLLDGTWVDVAAVDPATGAVVLRDPEPLAGLTDGTVLLPAWFSGEDSPRGTVTVAPVEAVDGTPVPEGDGTPVELEAVRSTMPGTDALVTPATMAVLDADAAPSVLWVRVADPAEAVGVLADIRDVVGDSGAALSVESPVAERAQYEQLITVLLAIVVGLLGVAVVIALIGVANTLSLSVIERRRESATLRAIGLSRSQLRAMLAVEGLLIAGVGALLGIGLGLLYGWAGAATVFGSMGPLRLAVPWTDLGLVLLVALAAGLLASVVPARAAARTSPVAALAVD